MYGNVSPMDFSILGCHKIHLILSRKLMSYSRLTKRGLKTDILKKNVYWLKMAQNWPQQKSNTLTDNHPTDIIAIYIMILGFSLLRNLIHYCDFTNLKQKFSIYLSMTQK